MKARRYAGHLVLAIGAIASVATSYAQNWELIANGEIEPTFVTSGPPVGFALAGVADGPDHADGDLIVYVTLSLQPDSVEMATARVVLASENGDPLRRQEQNVALFPGSPATVFFYATAWIDCDGVRCLDEFLLTVNDVTTNAEVTVSGTVEAILHGIDVSPHPTSAVALEITPLGAIRP
jgi:hypothetical protein